MVLKGDSAVSLIFEIKVGVQQDVVVVTDRNTSICFDRFDCLCPFFSRSHQPYPYQFSVHVDQRHFSKTERAQDCIFGLKNH